MKRGPDRLCENPRDPSHATYTPPARGAETPDRLREEAGVIRLETPRAVYEFLFPDGVCMRNLVLGVLKGRAYPVLNLPGYSPRVILDVGANVGAAAMYFHLHFPEATIHCYEPSGRNIPYLMHNTRDLGKVHVHPYGLFREAVLLPLFRGRDTPAQDSVGRSPEAGVEIERVRLEKAADEVGRAGVRSVSILKIDTEGCEIPILADLLRALDRIDLIYAEYHSETDRLEMDRMLAGTHYLVSARAEQIHRGTNLYASKELSRVFGLAGGEILLCSDPHREWFGG